MNLADRILAIHEALDAGAVEHAIGGAIALAYWTEEPRGTRDIDINIFVSPDMCETALDHLPSGVGYDNASIETIRRDAQVRLWWDETPVDLFFSNLPIHDEAARHRHLVPFEGTTIPILGPLELAFFKAMFDRTRDWADIEEMLLSKSFDPDRLAELIRELAGENDHRVARLDDAIARAGDR